MKWLYKFFFLFGFKTDALLVPQVTSLIIKRQTITNMESDMDRWIQDRDQLSKQLEKCQMKYDSMVASQKVRDKLLAELSFF